MRNDMRTVPRANKDAIYTEPYDGIITCDSCGRDLTATTRILTGAILVEPCSFCMNPPSSPSDIDPDEIRRAISILENAI